MGIHISKHLKEEFAWPIDKWLWVIRNTLFENSYTTKELKNKAV